MASPHILQIKVGKAALFGVPADRKIIRIKRV